MMREGVRCERKRSGISLQKRLEAIPSDVLEATTYSLSTSPDHDHVRVLGKHRPEAIASATQIASLTSVLRPGMLRMCCVHR
jgi:hypothetical protein